MNAKHKFPMMNADAIRIFGSMYEYSMAYQAHKAEEAEEENPKAQHDGLTPNERARAKKLSHAADIVKELIADGDMTREFILEELKVGTMSADLMMIVYNTMKTD